ncbi:uncharacterized protein LOC134689200 isoform X8 [Mytilus trossulus]|uniref:uncharacterized protein LOC134689200 isoform X8 n=1 Tax=Mytilus trossulus TaxID=6551 RepID=UPI003006C0C5
MVDRTEQLHRALNKFIYHVERMSNEDDPSGNGFHREYRELRDLAIKNRDTVAATHGRIPHNIRKNRYKDIVPFDDTRVTLREIPGVQGSDYINANYVLDAHKREGYIASQGPLPHTLEDFWRMIEEQNVKVVMMACREVEAGKKKCAQYWVEEGAELGRFGNYEVACIRKEELADDCIERHLQLITADGIQDVYQYHYTGWPDHGIPDDIDVILAMIKRMRDIRTKDPNHAAVVVHCSAGCGRTGTICAIDYAWEILKSGQLDEDFNLYEIVKSMREQRQSMIQTPEQYEMAHLAVKELFQKHIEIMNESEYINIEFKNDSDQVEAADNTDEDDNYADAASDFKKLQLDVLDTVRMYDHTDESPAIPDREPVIIETNTEVVKKIEHEHEPEKEVENLVKKPYVNVFQENYENTTPKIASEDIETPKVEVDPTPALTVQQRRASFEKTASQSHTELSSSKRISDSVLKRPVNQTKSVPNQFEQSVLPEVTPRTTIISQNTPPSGPQFAFARPQQPQVVSSAPPPPPQTSGPRFAGPVSPQTSVDENKPKFVSVINCTKTDSTITQGNRLKKQIGHQGSVKKSKSAAGGDNYELAQPIEEQSRNSSNHVTVNSESVYAVPDKGNGKTTHAVPDKGNGKTTHAVPDRGNMRSTHAVQDSVYSEVNKSSSTRPAPKECAYETIATTQSINSSAPRVRQYEEVVLPLDGEYSAVGDVSGHNDAPAIPKREYDDPEPIHETVKASTSITDKFKSKITTTFTRGQHCVSENIINLLNKKIRFNINPKSSGSSENTDSKASTIPGFNERIEKKVKGPRTMPWGKKHKS